MTPKERMLAAARGQLADMLPFAPRIDLWFHANKERGTLPAKYRGAASADEIALAEGWALHKVVLDFTAFGEDAIIDRTLGVYRIPTQGFLSHLSENVERRVVKGNDEIKIEYRTPVGAVSGAFVFTREMRRSGITVPWIKEHLLKTPSDFKVLGYIFETMQVMPAYDGFSSWADAIGENGLPVAYALTAGSPMHHIMKILLDSTEFYYQYKDHETEMRDLAERMGVYFEKVIDAAAGSPAQVILVGANFDDMLTYPPFFEEHILPWLQAAADKFHRRNKLLLCHTDGENKGLMNLLYKSGMDVADSVCPFPMTKVPIAEYYGCWGDKITIFGGIPSNLMLTETVGDEDFEAYLQQLFSAIVPGSRFILGVADTVPPDASFERLQRIQEVVQRRGKLPLAKSGRVSGISAPPKTNSMQVLQPEKSGLEPAGAAAALPFCMEIRKGVLAGDHKNTVALVQQALDRGVDAERLLNECLLAPMDVIGVKFTDGTVFIPEVLLSARVLNEAMLLLEPVLAARKGASGQSPLVLLGTVKGDLHDIGKNLVGIMLRSVGFRVKDLGVNVPAQKFVEEVAAEKPDILALSALLTTTMPEFKNVIAGIRNAGLRDKVRILVGGAPVTEQYAVSVGADGYGADAGQAAAKAKTLCSRPSCRVGGIR